MTDLNDDRYKIAHIKARLSGEENANHPRQRLCVFLEREGFADKVAAINLFHEINRIRVRSWSLRTHWVKDALRFAFTQGGQRFFADPVFPNPDFPNPDFLDRALEHDCPAITLSQECLEELRSLAASDPTGILYSDDVLEPAYFAQQYFAQQYLTQPAHSSSDGVGPSSAVPPSPASIHAKDQPPVFGRMGP